MTDSNQPDLRPNPDPTVLTTQAMLREVAVAKELMDARFDSIEARLSMLKEALEASIVRSDDKAQAANDGLQRLLEANMAATASLASSRIESTQTAITKVESQLNIAHAAAESVVNAVDRRITDRITAMDGMISLRSEMGQTAIAKAEQATDARFSSVNEFRKTLTDQAQAFVTRPVMEARFEQVTTTTARNLEAVTALSARLSGLEGRLYIGGASLVILVTVIQLALNFFRHV